VNNPEDLINKVVQALGHSVALMEDNDFPVDQQMVFCVFLTKRAAGAMSCDGMMATAIHPEVLEAIRNGKLEIQNLQ
jgi:hypothetical protein